MHFTAAIFAVIATATTAALAAPLSTLTAQPLQVYPREDVSFLVTRDAVEGLNTEEFDLNKRGSDAAPQEHFQPVDPKNRASSQTPGPVPQYNAKSADPLYQPPTHLNVQPLPTGPLRDKIYAAGQAAGQHVPINGVRPPPPAGYQGSAFTRPK
ncbi:hypothetical protein EIP91_002256 [Steccherinum ochraceum]|uniref:Uncharacterized protein n=1 Tax=Steccherinum ochraceum TaxID=92696 RepID=A0A4V2MWC2_9APHY|nr:hypothetical protein EIP91_002256 [Steccherinum ochraceum]